MGGPSVDPLATPYPTAGRSRELVAKGLEEPRPQGGGGVSHPQPFSDVTWGHVPSSKFSSLYTRGRGAGSESP